MKTLLTSAFAVLTASAFPLSAQSALGNPLAGLEQLKTYETRRASSSDANWNNGNADARPIAPGGTLTLAELEGPGVITHLWFTIAHDAPFYSRLLTLRMYWDGEQHPSVECPVGDFFGIGHGVDRSFISLPVRVTSDGRARNCYWPMPFRKSARITVTNESDQRCPAFYYYVDWQKHASLPEDTAYFHAAYRQEHPCGMGRNYLLAEIDRARPLRRHGPERLIHAPVAGTAKATIFSSSMATASRSSAAPARKIISATAGATGRSPTARTTARPCSDNGHPGRRLPRSTGWHLPDPIAFKKSLRVEMEHKGAQQLPRRHLDWLHRARRPDVVAALLVPNRDRTSPGRPFRPAPQRLPFRRRPRPARDEAVRAAKNSGAPARRP